VVQGAQGYLLGSTIDDALNTMSLAQDYLEHAADFDRIVKRVLASGVYILGSEVASFEALFRDWLDASHVVGCANGTDAITLALMALDLPPHSKVATVSHTAVATVAGIQRAGCIPVLLDVRDDYLLDVDELSSVLATSDIAAVVVVHLYGRPAPIDDIIHLCGRHGAFLVEDCSQAHGATIGGRKVGTFGDASSFSFYPTKNLGAFGDGGAVACASSVTAERLLRLRQYGWDVRRESLEPGFNSRLDELQAALLSFKLSLLDRSNDKRRQVAAFYDRHLQGLDVAIPKPVVDAECVFHQYVVRGQRRDELLEFMARRGISVAVHYRKPVHLHPAYLNTVLLGPLRCQHTEEICHDIISLPIDTHMTESDVIGVADTVRAFYDLR
jgi:dTDP-4-amino-4,6-dideoxygalactose transaminase